MKPGAVGRFRYDAFISYSHRNKDWVRGWLVPRLKAAGIRGCIDCETFEPGAPSITEIERGILQSRKTVLVLTPEYLESGWAEFENILVQTQDPATHGRRVLPVLRVRCLMPPRIGILTYVDFTGPADPEAMVVRLTESIRQRTRSARRRSGPTATSLAFEVPTGPLAPDSPLYIERSHDATLRRAACPRREHHGRRRGQADGQELLGPGETSISIFKTSMNSPWTTYRRFCASLPISFMSDCGWRPRPSGSGANRSV